MQYIKLDQLEGILQGTTFFEENYSIFEDALESIDKLKTALDERKEEMDGIIAALEDVRTCGRGEESEIIREAMNEARASRKLLIDECLQEVKDLKNYVNDVNLEEFEIMNEAERVAIINECDNYFEVKNLMNGFEK